MAEPNDLSLYDELSSRNYEAAVVATYNASFGFYERVMLRRLQVVGCRAHLLLTDARQCSRAFASDEDLPEFAGAEYGLIPVRAPGAFHPKFVLLLGPKRARLIVGSHNVTVCGFGLNREVTSLFDIDAAKPSAGLARQVWRFVHAWTADQPEAARDVRDAVLQIAPWLQSTSETDAGDVLCWTGPGRASLWDQVRPFLARRVTRVSAVSPYFDADCGFLRRVVPDLETPALLVGIEPGSSECPPEAKALLPDARFLDVSSLGPGWDKRLHAKIFRFEHEGGGSVVVTGSANASRSAWLTPDGGGNAELVVVHSDGDAVWSALGLDGFVDLPEVGADVWQALRARKEASVEEPRAHATSLFHAAVVPQGFEVDAAFVAGDAAPLVEALAGRQVLGSLSPRPESGGRVVLPCDDPTVVEATTLLRVSLADGARRFAIVTRVDDLRGKAAGSAQQKFRLALSGLQGDPEQLANLFRLVQKALFDQEPLLQAASPSAGQGPPPNAEANEGEGAERVLTSLKMSPAELLKQRHHRRVAPSSEIASIIDALIYQLGIRAVAEPPPPPPEDEEPEDPDTPREPDRTHDGSKEPTGAVRAAQCRSKVNSLFRRMAKQLDAAEAPTANVTVAIVQLAAVLGIVKYLRLGIVDWLPKNDRLVDVAQARDFFTKACRSLYGPTRDLAARALADNNGEPFDELTSVRALLAWLAFDSGVNAETLTRDLKESPDDARVLVLGVACLLPVATDCAQDAHAGALLVHTLAARPSDAATAERHLTWAKRVDAAAANAVAPAPGPLKVGDIVVPFKAKSLRPFVVSEVLHGKTGVVDLDRLDYRYFVDGWLAPIQLQRLGASTPGPVPQASR